MLQLKWIRWVAGFLALCVLGAVFLRAPAWAEEKPQSASAKEIQNLIRQLGDDEFVEREKAKKRLRQIGMPAVEALRETVGSATDPEVHRRAKDLLEKIDPVGVRRVELEARRAALRKAIEKAPGIDVKNWAESIANPFRELTEEGKKRLTAVGIDVARLQKMRARYLKGNYCGANSVDFVNMDEDTILVVGKDFCTHGGVYSAGPVLATENAYFMSHFQVANLLWFVDKAGGSDAVQAAPAIAADGAGIHARRETAGILLGDYGWRRPKDLLRPPTAEEAKNDPPPTKEMEKARKELAKQVKKAQAVDVKPFAEEIANPFTALTEEGKQKLKLRGIEVDRLLKLKAVHLTGNYSGAARKKDFVNNDADTILVIGRWFLTDGHVYSLGPILVVENAQFSGNVIGADLVWFAAGSLPRGRTSGAPVIHSGADARSRMEVADKHIWHGDYGWRAPKSFPEPVKKRSDKRGAIDWQLLLVIVLVIPALLYLGRQTLRTWRGKGGGCGGCKHHGTASTTNDAAKALIPLEQVRLRRR